MPYYVTRRLMDALNGAGKALSTSRVLVLGVAYKADIDDLRESPAIRIVELLAKKGADVVYHDPHVERFEAGGREIARVGLTTEELAAADAVLVVTAHRNVDYGLVAKEAALVLDTRNALEGLGASNVVRL